MRCADGATVVAARAAAFTAAALAAALAAAFTATTPAAISAAADLDAASIPLQPSPPPSE